MSEEDKQKYRQYMKEWRKNRFSNVLKKLKENNKLKKAKSDVVTSFIKRGSKKFSDAEVYTDDN